MSSEEAIAKARELQLLGDSYEIAKELIQMVYEAECRGFKQAADIMGIKYE